MGKTAEHVADAKVSTSIGGPEFFNGGKVPFNYETLHFMPTKGSFDRVKGTLSSRLKEFPAHRDALTILKKRYALHSALEITTPEVQAKRKDELAATNDLCNASLASIFRMYDGYAYNDIFATVMMVKQLEASYRTAGVEFPVCSTDDALADLLAQPIPERPTPPESTEPYRGLAGLADLWSGSNLPALRPTRRSPNP